MLSFKKKLNHAYKAVHGIMGNLFLFCIFVLHCVLNSRHSQGNATEVKPETALLKESPVYDWWNERPDSLVVQLLGYRVPSDPDHSQVIKQKTSSQEAAIGLLSTMC